MRLAQSGRANPWLLIALGCAGALLVALPWIPRSRPMPLPPVIEDGSDAHRHLLRVASRADAACARGDVVGLRSLLTPSHWGEVETLMRSAGKQIDPHTLREQRYLIGDLSVLRLLHGAASGSSAVLVFERSASPLEEGRAARRSLFAVRFSWDGSELRVDAKRNLVIGPAIDGAARAREWVGELLGE